MPEITEQKRTYIHRGDDGIEREYLDGKFIREYPRMKDFYIDKKHADAIKLDNILPTIDTRFHFCSEGWLAKDAYRNHIL